jgi:hypothetical protein
MRRPGFDLASILSVEFFCRVVISNYSTREVNPMKVPDNQRQATADEAPQQYFYAQRKSALG